MHRYLKGASPIDRPRLAYVGSTIYVAHRIFTIYMCRGRHGVVNTIAEMGSYLPHVASGATTPINRKNNFALR